MDPLRTLVLCAIVAQVYPDPSRGLGPILSRAENKLMRVSLYGDPFDRYYLERLQQKEESLYDTAWRLILRGAERAPSTPRGLAWSREVAMIQAVQQDGAIVLDVYLAPRGAPLQIPFLGIAS